MALVMMPVLMPIAMVLVAVVGVDRLMERQLRWPGLPVPMAILVAMRRLAAMAVLSHQQRITAILVAMLLRQ
jgi:hypothetical protein